MKNKNIILVCVVLFTLLGESCKKWLDELPINTVTEDQAWKTGADAEGAVAAGFAIFRRALSGLTKDDTPATTRNGSWGDYFFLGRCPVG